MAGYIVRRTAKKDLNKQKVLSAYSATAAGFLFTPQNNLMFKSIKYSYVSQSWKSGVNKCETACRYLQHSEGGYIATELSTDAESARKINFMECTVLIRGTCGPSHEECSRMRHATRIRARTGQFF